MTDKTDKGAIIEARDALIYSSVGSCTCLTKTNDVNYHEDNCRFKVIQKAIERLDDEVINSIKVTNLEKYIESGDDHKCRNFLDHACTVLIIGLRGKP